MRYLLLCAVVAIHPLQADPVAKPIPVEEIGLTHLYASVLIVDAPIDSVEIGNKDFMAKINHNYLLLRAAHAQAEPTSLFITYAGSSSFVTLTLHINHQAPKAYDLRKNAAIRPTKFKSIAQQALDSLQRMQPVYTDIGIRNSRLTVGVSNLLAYQGNAYIKLFLQSHTQATIHITDILFLYQQKALGPCATDTQTACPVRHTAGTLTLEPQGSQWIRLVVPLPSQSTAETLKIDFIELSGQQCIGVDIPIKELRSAPTYIPWCEEDLT